MEVHTSTAPASGEARMISMPGFRIQYQPWKQSESQALKINKYCSEAMSQTLEYSIMRYLGDGLQYQLQNSFMFYVHFKNTAWR